MLRLRLAAGLALALSLAASGAWAQALGITSSPGSSPTPAAAPGAPSAAPAQAGGSTPAAPLPAPLPTATAPAVNAAATAMVTMNDGTQVQIFGSSLFSGAFASAHPGALPTYVIQPGDQIAVHVYGAVNSDAIQTVDNSGRLFVQGIGAVQVGGMAVSQLQTQVTNAVRAVYTNAVSVYASIVNGGTLGVYLAGDVLRNGRYIGSPGDTLLYFLDQAGGIDPNRGSFRDISVLRGGKTVAHYDLYDFLQKGVIEPFKFQDGDTIFVGSRGAIVAVTGTVRNSYAYETAPGAKTISGSDLLDLAEPVSTSTSATVTKAGNGVRNAAYYTLAQLANVQLGDGSTVGVRADIFTETISVTLSGDIRGQTAFSLPRNTMLSQLLAQIPLEGTDIVRDAIHIQRASVAAAQTIAQSRALDALQRAVVTEPVYGADTAAAKTIDVSAVQMYIASARQSVPDGTVVVYANGVFHDIQLESGDVVILPSRTDVVLVGGEVLSPGAFSHAPNLTARDYIMSAGGFGENADKKHVVFRRQDGSALVADSKAKPRPGDQITVVPDFTAGRNIGIFKDLTQIIFQIATTAAVAITLADR